MRAVGWFPAPEAHATLHPAGRAFTRSTNCVRVLAVVPLAPSVFRRTCAGGKPRKGADVGSSGKKRTTMAKLNREAKLRDKRAQKQTRKAARKLSAERDAEEPDSGPEEPGTSVAGPSDAPGDEI